MKPITELPANVETFNTLHAYLNDSVKGYERVAEKFAVAAPENKPTLDTIIESRRMHEQYFANMLRGMNEGKPQSGTIAGTAHRALIEIKDLFTSDDDVEALVNEVLRGEAKLVEYIDANFDLKGPQDNPLIKAIVELKTSVLGSIHTVRCLAPETTPSGS